MSSTMNLKSKLYQKSVLDRIEETDWKGGNRAPFVVELDPTAACDLACPGCISEDLIALGNRFSDERLMSLGQEFIDCGVKAVILIGGGEPLAHRKIGEFIRLMGENDVHIGITTNGSFIDRYLDVIAEYSKWTRVSMDAATEEMFSILRPTKSGNGNKFSKIVDNMARLAKIKHGRLGYSFLVQTPADGIGNITNIGEIYAAAVLAKSIGCDYFEVKPSYQWRGGIAHALMKHPKGLMDVAAEEIARLDSLESDSFKILKAINLKYSLEGVEHDQPKNYKECPSTHLRTTVTPTGVFVCPYWRGKEHMKVGDVNNKSFTEVWRSNQRESVMEQLNVSRDCGFHCLRNDTNLEAMRIKEEQKGVNVSESFQALQEFDRFI
jgi:MoaA/NifB/PqqE/SkfB family radical SAM enzyme